MNEETNYSDETPETENEHQHAEPVAETTNTQLHAGMTIGELLRSKREERGLNLKTISQQTKIHMGLLEHLENNDLAKLPSKTYVRGFVKSAAKILNINQDEALDVLEATYNRDHRSVKKQAPNIEMRTEAAKNTLSAITATPLETVRSVTMSSSAFIAKAAVILLIVGVVGFNVKNLFDRNAEERLKLPKVLSTIHQKTKSAPKVVVPKAAPKTEAELAAAAKVNPIQVNIIQDKKDTPAKTEMTINDVNLKNISLGEKQFTEDNSLTGEKLDEIFPPKYRVKPVKGQENVFINAVDGDSWITYKVDDKDIKKYVLRQGRSVFMRGEKIRLFIGNTKTLKIFYNNKLISLKGGTTKNLVFPEELKTKYMSPLFVFQKDGSVVTSDEYIKANQPATTPTPTATPSKVPATTPATPTVKHL
jgi:cytoskeletal protein RodZ